MPDLASLASDLKQVPANLVLINAPDLQTLDWTVEMARRSIRDTPVIGCVFSRQTLPVLEKGVVRSLVKPVTQQDLSAAVKELNRPVKHVLLVDNDLDIISLYTRMLENHVSALQISTATGGIEGLSLMKSRRPDLVMLDLSMPDMDGMTVLDIKSQDPEICDIPVIIISALDLRAMPLQTRLVMATMADGLGPTKLMECAVGLSEILLKPGMILGQAPG